METDALHTKTSCSQGHPARGRMVSCCGNASCLCFRRANGVDAKRRLCSNHIAKVPFPANRSGPSQQKNLLKTVASCYFGQMGLLAGIVVAYCPPTVPKA